MKDFRPLYGQISEITAEIITLSGHSCSKHRQPNKLINDKLINCCSYGIFKYIAKFAAKT